MHKTSLMSALALVVTLAASAGAQGVSTDHPARPQGTEQQGGFRRGGRGGPEGMLLKGITLSADQKQKLADLRTREREAWQKDHPNAQQGAERQRRQPGDTTGFAARRAEMEKRFDARIAEVRNILTADQRTQFDKNVAELKAHRAENRGRFGGRGEKKEAR